MDGEVDRNADTKENDEVDRNADTKENDEVDRNADTKEDDEVDRNAETKDPEVDRNRSTQEDESAAIIFYVHPVSDVNKSDLHLGFKPPKLPSPSIPLHINQQFIFGRGEGVSLFLNDDTASRTHMELSAHLNMATPQHLQFVVKNLSKKPVRINNVDLQLNQQRLLNSGDVIKIGSNTFTVDINPTAFTNEGRYFLEVGFLQVHQQNYNVVNGLPVNQVNHGIQPPMMMPYNPGVMMPQPGMGLQGMYPLQNMSGYQAHQGTLPGHPGMGFSPQVIGNYQQHQMPYPSIQGQGTPFMPQQFPMQEAASNTPGIIAHNFITGNHHAQPVQEQANFQMPFSSSQQAQPQPHIPPSTPTVNQPPRPERQISAQERREAFGQGRGTEASENDDTSLSMEETSKQCETSFEETEPPKDKD